MYICMYICIYQHISANIQLLWMGVMIWGPDLDGLKISSFWTPQNHPKTAQIHVYSMYLHMYNMYLYASIHIRTCIICDNMLNTCYEGYPMAWLGVVMDSWWRWMT